MNFNTSQLLQKLSDIVGDIFGFEVAGVASDWFASFVNQKFFKVPRQVGATDRGPNDEARVGNKCIGSIRGEREVLFQVFEDWVRARSVDLSFLKYGERRNESVTRAQIFERRKDLCIVCVFLVSELITRECQHSQLVAKFGDQVVELGVIPCSRAS